MCEYNKTTALLLSDLIHEMATIYRWIIEFVPRPSLTKDEHDIRGYSSPI